MVTNKRLMYEMLHAGKFGNTSPMWLDLWSWLADYNGAEGLYGIRSLTPSGPCYMNVTKWKVPNLWKPGMQISCMVDHMRTACMNVWDSPQGLHVEYATHQPGATWRELMANPVALRNTTARMFLRRHLNENSYDDLCELLALYPSHIIELTALDKCLGAVLGRNSIVRECRMY